MTTPIRTIDETERQRRVRAVAEARASVALEGLTLPDETKSIDERFFRGELTNAQHTAEYLRLAGVR